MKILAYICAIIFFTMLMADGETIKHLVIQFALITITGTYLVYYDKHTTIRNSK